MNEKVKIESMIYEKTMYVEVFKEENVNITAICIFFITLFNLCFTKLHQI